MANNISETMACKGPGMYRLHDEHGMVAPCPTCGRHHFGPTGDISDSIVFTIPAAIPTLGQRIFGLVCRFRGHRWGHMQRLNKAHGRLCMRCGAGRLTQPVAHRDRSEHKVGP
jgi:hypothetical protein